MIFIKKSIIIISIIAIITIAIGCLTSTPQKPDSSLPSPNPIATTKQTPIPTISKESITPSPIMTTGQAPIPTIPTECVVPAKGAGTYLHMMSDLSQDLPGILIWVTPVAVQCSLKEPTYTNSTNSTGWAYLGSLPANYEFEVSLIYNGKDYNISIPQEPLYNTYATLKLPSGNLTIIVCDLRKNCKPY